MTWGVLSFGAVYPWAYWPLLTVAAVVGALGMFNASHALRRLTVDGSVAAALMMLCLATALQLTPFPATTLASLSPATERFLRQYDVAFAVTAENPRITSDAPGDGVGRPAAHALSINPQATRVGLAFLACFGIFPLGLTVVLSRTGARPLALGLIGIGLLVAVIGIVQQPLYAGKIYGFWEPQQKGRAPFGPFVNPHHFAGWMMMMISVTGGYFCARLAQAMRGVKREWRSQLLWFSSPDANKLLIVGFSLIVMTLSLVLTLSRSGISALALAFVIATGIVGRRLRGTSRRRFGASYFAVALMLAVAWVGVDVVADRFAGASWETIGGRLGAWKDSINVIEDFPLTGTGLNTYGSAMLLYQTFEVDLHYQEAHNDYLQLAAEGGLLLGIPAILAFGFFVRAVRQRFREPSDETTYWIRAGAVIGLVAIGLQEIVDFSLQMPGNATLFCVLAAIAVHRAPALRRVNVPATISSSHSPITVQR